MASIWRAEAIVSRTRFLFYSSLYIYILGWSIYRGQFITAHFMQINWVAQMHFTLYLCILAYISVIHVSFSHKFQLNRQLFCFYGKSFELNSFFFLWKRIGKLKIAIKNNFKSIDVHLCRIVGERSNAKTKVEIIFA